MEPNVRFQEIERRLSILEAETHGKNGVLEELSAMQEKLDNLTGRVTALLVFGSSLLLALLGAVIAHATIAS